MREYLDSVPAKENGAAVSITKEHEKLVLDPGSYSNA